MEKNIIILIVAIILILLIICFVVSSVISSNNNDEDEDEDDPTDPTDPIVPPPVPDEPDEPEEPVIDYVIDSVDPYAIYYEEDFTIYGTGFENGVSVKTYKYSYSKNEEYTYMSTISAEYIDSTKLKCKFPKYNANNPYGLYAYVQVVKDSKSSNIVMLVLRF